jgi:hypothetical protein
VRDASFTGNVCRGRGGAAFLGNGLQAEFTGTVFTANRATAIADPRGGAIMIDSRLALTTATFTDCEWIDNESGGPGGAMSTLSAAVTVEDSRVVGSRSGTEIGWSEGAGLHFRRNVGDHSDPTPAVARRCEFVGNVGEPDLALAAGDGGAFYANGAAGGLMVDILVEDCLFRENFNLQGAGVYISRYAEGAVRRSQFFDNIAQYHAGGVFKGGHLYANRGETLEIDTCLFVRNLAGFTADGLPNDDYCRGGAIVCRMFPRVVVRHCTFIDNRIDDPGYHFGDAFAHYFEYGFWEPEMLCVMQNCVFWGDSGVDVQAWSSEGGMALAENNAAAAGELDLGGVAATGTVTLTASPFADLETGHPAAGSPLIDAGVDLGFTVDLAGEPMPVGAAPDIGCYEFLDTTGAPLVPASDVALTAGPNPFNPRTVLSCRLAAAADVQLVLHDARGRQVRQLWQGRLAAGEHRWTWDGRDDAGRECATGVYLARLIVGERQAVRKLTLVR